MSASIILRRVGFALLCSVATGCPSEGEDAPTDISTTGEDTTGNTLSASTSLETTVATTAPETTVGESTDTTEGPDDTTTTGGPECLGPDGCWQCTPQNSGQLLDACTDAACAAFDNPARLPLLGRDGSLPALP